MVEKKITVKTKSLNFQIWWLEFSFTSRLWNFNKIYVLWLSTQLFNFQNRVWKLKDFFNSVHQRLFLIQGTFALDCMVSIPLLIRVSLNMCVSKRQELWHTPSDAEWTKAVKGDVFFSLGTWKSVPRNGLSYFKFALQTNYRNQDGRFIEISRAIVAFVARGGEVSPGLRAAEREREGTSGFLPLSADRRRPHDPLPIEPSVAFGVLLIGHYVNFTGVSGNAGET